MIQKLDIQKLAIKLIQEENLNILQNIIDQSQMIKAAERVTLSEREQPKLDNEDIDDSVQWLSMAVVAFKHTDSQLI